MSDLASKRRQMVWNDEPDCTMNKPNENLQPIFEGALALPEAERVDYLNRPDEIGALEALQWRTAIVSGTASKSWLTGRQARVAWLRDALQKNA